MYSFLLGLHVIVCLLLVIIVLLQSGKAADLAGAFGGMGSQSTFGPRGTASFLSKMTTTLAVLFMVTSLSLWIFGTRETGPKTVVEGVTQEQTTQAPAPTETEKAGQTETTQDTKGQQSDSGVPVEEKSSDTGKKEADQEKPPDTSDSK